MPNDPNTMGGVYGMLVDYLRSAREAVDPFPKTGSIPQDLAGSLPLASLGLRPSGMRLTPTNTANPRLQVRGRFAGHTNEAMLGHPAVGKWPFIASGQLASNMYGSDDAPTIERPQPPPMPAEADLMANTEGQTNIGAAPPASGFEGRFGGMAPPSSGPRQDPLFLQSGYSNVPSQYAERWKMMSPSQQIALALARK